MEIDIQRTHTDKPSIQSLCTDRTQLLPSHEGYNVFPNTPLFSRLLRHASRGRIAVRDDNFGTEKSYTQLLSDVLAVRQILRDRLSDEVLSRLQNGEEVYIGVLALGGYEYTVAMLAVVATGAAMVPMTVTLPVEEAVYFVTRSQQVAILTSESASNLAEDISRYVKSRHSQTVQIVPILPNLPHRWLAHSSMVISSDQYLSDNSAGIVIFTSGTTGPPKGAVMRRGFLFEGAVAIADHYDITSSDMILHVLPVHHATGIGISFFPFLVSGALIEFRSGSFDPAWIWQRWKKGGTTFFSGVPTMYMRLMRYYEHHLKHLPNAKEFVRGVREVRAMTCGSSALPKPMQDFWTEIRDGKILLTRYGATEFAAVFMVALDPSGTPEGSVGKHVPGIDVKLSNGDEGEVLVRSNQMFSKYLYDGAATVAATVAAHVEEGYFRTGDIAKRQGDYYWIMGRASLDIIKSGGYKISALDIERELLGLPYISEAMVVRVADLEFGQRVAALVTLREDQRIYSSGTEGERLTIDNLRKDLRSKLAGYKMPTLLRIVEGELPKGQSGKVQKKIVGPDMFPSPGWETHPQVQVWKKSDQKSKL
ncbi:acetyl-CoA synthetase-like protein [Cadophora sp. DSE1049]|nr:acetyl-CoA synthetase-like protein [Cadophora sp. DSE1049]